MQRRDRLAGEAELGIVIVLDDVTVFALRGPIEKRVTPCDGRDDARREVVRRRNVQNIRAAFFERFGVYPLFIHRRETVLHAVALVHLRNFAIAGIFERVDLIEPQKLDEKPVEVLRSGADDDAVRVGIDAAKLPKVLGDGAP